MTFGVGKDEDGHSYLQITTNYVWAYAFAGVGTNHPGEHVVVVHDETKWGSYSDSHVGPPSPVGSGWRAPKRTSTTWTANKSRTA